MAWTFRFFVFDSGASSSRNGDIAVIDERLIRTMTDDATWEVVGKPHLYGGAGVQSKAQMAHIWPALYAKLDGRLQMRVTGMIAERELVAAEVRSDATTITGKRYQNDYHFLITVRDGRIAKVKEYTDLMHAAEVFD